MININNYFVPGIFTTIFATPFIQADSVTWTKRSLEKDHSLESFVDQKWNTQVENKKKDLDAEGTLNITIRQDERGLLAVYEGERKIMFDGTIFRVYDVHTAENKIILSLEEGRFSTINLSKDPEYRTLLKNKYGKVRNDALGSSALLLTTDQYIVLTNRGEKTNTYKNQMYMPGGRPSIVDESPLEHQLGENNEELGLDPHHFSSIHFYGIVADEQLNGNRELMFQMNLTLDSAEVKKSYDSLQKKPIDVASLEFLPATPESVLSRLIQDTPYQKERTGIVVPPTYGTLVHFGFNTYGQEWLNELDANISQKLH